MMYGESYATVEDVEALWRPLSTDEESRAEALLPVISDVLRCEAARVGRDLDRMIENIELPENVVKSVTVDVLARVLMTSTNAEPTTQFSQSAMGYSVSGTYLVPGGGLYIKKAELARLGLRRQRMGVIDFGPD